MILERFICEDDLPLLADSLAKDEHHQGTAPGFFTEDGTVCTVYSDDAGPVCFVRGSKTLRLSVLFSNSDDSKRNLYALENGVSHIADKARAHGFKEIIVQTDSPELRAIATEKFGFVEADGELVRGL